MEQVDSAARTAEPVASVAVESNNSESDVATVTINKRNRKRVSSLTDSSSDDGKVDFHPVARSSPKRAKTVALQKKVSRAEAMHPSQMEAIVTLTDRARKAEAAWQSANKEVGFYKAKEEMYKKQAEQAKADREEVVTKVGVRGVTSLPATTDYSV